MLRSIAAVRTEVGLLQVARLERALVLFVEDGGTATVDVVGGGLRRSGHHGPGHRSVVARDRVAVRLQVRPVVGVGDHRVVRPNGCVHI